MLGLDEYASYDGLGLAGLVARGDVTPGELRDSALRAIEQVNPELNAVLQVLAERSAEEIQAGVPEGPFRGVPFLIKELVLHAADVALDMGSRFAEGSVVSHDTELLARFRRAGLVLVGTTQTPELGYCPTTETVLHGPVHNPWKTGRSPGGSSGGSAASVAAGIVPLAHANDGGGSIRIPASCNGLVGLKPTRDRVPSGPDMSDPLFGWAIEFAVTKTVRDAATLLDCVAGPDVGAPGHLIPPSRPFADEVGRAPGKLRIAWTTSPASGKEVHPECRAAVEATAALLEDLGHRVSEASPSFVWDEFLHATHVIWAAYTAGAVDLLASTNGREPSPDNLEAATWACYEEGRKLSAGQLIAALDYGNVLSRSLGAFFEEYDVLVTPTLARPPVPHGEIDQDRSGITAWEWTEQVFDWCPFTPVFNTTGQPAVSVPLHWSDEGLPVGVHFAGRFADEATLIRLAAQLEEARPWSERRPTGHVAA